MTTIDIEKVSELLFAAVNKYVNDYMGDMRKYVDGRIDTVKADTDQVEERLLKLRVDAIDQTKDYVGREIEGAEARIQNKPANPDAGTVAELTGTTRNLERRALRHADHLLKLESRVRALEEKKNGN